MILKLLKRAQTESKCKDLRTGLAVQVTGEAVVITRHDELCLIIIDSQITYSNIKTTSELHGFQAVLTQLGVPYTLMKGVNNYIKEVKSIIGTTFLSN